MSRKLLSAGFLVALSVVSVFGVCETASAGGGGGGFWEKMSGPGKWFYAFAYYDRCLAGGEVVGEKRICSQDNAKWWLNVGGSYARTGPEEQGAELQSPTLQVVSFEPSVDYRVKNLFERMPFYLGVGAGVHRFFGDDVGLTRFSMEPRISLVLLETDSWHFGFRYAPKVFFQGFSASDFGDPMGTFDTDGPDIVSTFSVFFGF